MYGRKQREDTRCSSTTHEPLVQQPGACCNASWGRGPMSVREHRYINPMARGLWISGLSPLLPFVWEIKHRHKLPSDRFEVNEVSVSFRESPSLPLRARKIFPFATFRANGFAGWPYTPFVPRRVYQLLLTHDVLLSTNQTIISSNELARDRLKDSNFNLHREFLILNETVSQSSRALGMNLSRFQFRREYSLKRNAALSIHLEYLSSDFSPRLSATDCCCCCCCELGWSPPVFHPRSRALKPCFRFIMRRRDARVIYRDTGPMYFRHFTRELSRPTPTLHAGRSLDREQPRRCLFTVDTDHREVINYRLTRVNARERAARAFAISRHGDTCSRANRHRLKCTYFLFSLIDNLSSNYSAIWIIHLSDLPSSAWVIELEIRKAS